VTKYLLGESSIGFPGSPGSEAYGGDGDSFRSPGQGAWRLIGRAGLLAEVACPY